MNTYKLEVTENQLYTIQLALEILGRLRIGQINLALDVMQNEKGESHIIDWKTSREVEAIIKPLLGLELNSSFGVGKFENADIAWDLYEVIRNRLAWDNALENGKITQEEYDNKIRTTNTGGCFFAEPFHWNSKEPLAKIYK